MTGPHALDLTHLPMADWVGGDVVGGLVVVLYDSGRCDGVVAGQMPPLRVEVRRQEPDACTVVLVQVCHEERR